MGHFTGSVPHPWMTRALLPLALSTLVFQAAVAQTAPAAEPKIDSPRLATLWQELKAGNAAALDAFWLEIKGKAPLVEPIPGDDRNLRVTFIRRGNDSTRSVFLIGGLPGHPADKQLLRLGVTNLWFRTERLPSDARFNYGFGVLSGSGTQPSEAGDPLNPRGGEVELPGAPPLPWLQPMPEVPQGTLTRQALKSAILKGSTQRFSLYTPPGYNSAGDRYGLLILFDGEVYRDRNQVPCTVAMNNLIAKQQILPLVAVFVDNQNTSRQRDLTNSAGFADFLAEELVPWVRQNCHVSTEPGRVIVGGASLGGLQAAYCAFRHPQVFGNVLSQSGSFWVWEKWPSVSTRPVEVETGWLTRQFAISQPLPVRFFLSAGRFETWPDIDLLLENRRLRDVLEARGCLVTYREVNSGHDLLNWRSTIAEGLIALAAPPKPQ